jgi:hypothetical protein
MSIERIERQIQDQAAEIASEYQQRALPLLGLCYGLSHPREGEAAC